MATITRKTSKKRDHNRHHDTSKLMALFVGLPIILASMLYVYFIISATGALRNHDLYSAFYFGILVINLLSVCMAIFSARFGLVEIVVLYFMTISAAFSGFYEYSASIYPWERLHSEHDMLLAYLIFLSFLASFLLGNHIASARPAPKSHTLLPTRKLLLHLLLIVGVACVFLMSGINQLLTPRAMVGDLLGDGAGSTQALFIGKGLCLAAFLFSFSMWQQTGRYATLLLFLGALTVICFNPITNPRFQFIGATLAFLSMWKVLQTPKPLAKALTFAGLFIANYFIFGPLKALSDGANHGLSLEAFGKGVAEYAFRVDFDIMQVAANTVIYVRDQGVDLGFNIIGAFLFFVPRALWPAKPYSSSMYVHDYLGYQYINLSAPLPAEFYYAGGFLGVIILAAMFGYGLRRIGQAVANSRSVTYEGVLLAIVTGYMPIIMRGSLNAVLPAFGFAVIAYIFITWRCGRKPEPHLPARRMQYGG